MIAALESRGLRALALDTAAFPTDWQLSHEAGLAGDGSIAGIAMSALAAVWVRAIEPGAHLLPMDESHRLACVSQCAAALWAWLDGVAAFVLDPPHALLGMPAKPGQQRRAARLGLDVPLFLVTHDPQALRAFARRCPHGLVGKLIASGPVGVVSASGASQAFPTFEVTEQDLLHLDGLALAPLLFQERLRSKREVRLTVVGQRHFAAAMRPGQQLDLRHDPEALASLHPINDLPAPLVERVFALVDELGLDLAAADLIETIDGRWVFLELNAPFHFDHVEQRAGLPIAAAVADLLSGTAPSRFEPRRRLQAQAWR